MRCELTQYAIRIVAIVRSHLCKSSKRSPKCGASAGSGPGAGAWCRRWAFCTRGTSRWSSGRGARTTTSASRSSSTRRSSGRPRTWPPIRATWSATWRCSRRRARTWSGRRRSEEVYPPGFQTYVTVEEVTRPLEGAARPTHFRGVATVVAKLFNVFQPDRAYFGQKDAQQARGHPADGPRPRLPAGGRHLSRSCASRTGWRCRRATST